MFEFLYSWASKAVPMQAISEGWVSRSQEVYFPAFAIIIAILLFIVAEIIILKLGEPEIFIGFVGYNVANLAMCVLLSVIPLFFPEVLCWILVALLVKYIGWRLYIKYRRNENE